MQRPLISLLAGSALLFGALTASAQESRPERPYRGLFGGGTDQSQQVLTVNASAGTGFDTNAQLGAAESGLQTGAADPRSGIGNTYNNYSGGLSYTAALTKLSAGASFSSSARQYPGSDLETTTSHAASAGLGLAVAKNTRVNGGLSATYQSTRSFSPFAELGEPGLGQLTAPNLDYGTGRGKYYSLGTTAGVSQQLGRRSSLTASYDRHSSMFDGGSEDLTYQTGAFRFTRGLTRYFSLRLGYGYTDARYESGATTYQNHNLDTGVDYSRDLSLTRRTRLSFTTGATALRQDQTTRYDVIGTARLTRELARSWSSQISYNRSVGFLESVLEPTFSDAVNAGIDGLITRRLSFEANGGLTGGAIGVKRGAGNGFSAFTGSARVNTALTRHLALGVGYTFYRYRFDPGATLVTGLPSHINRHSVSVNLNAWAPLFQHGKRANASR
jgi:hypothetical protein